MILNNMHWAPFGSRRATICKILIQIVTCTIGTRDLFGGLHLRFQPSSWTKWAIPPTLTPIIFVVCVQRTCVSSIAIHFRTLCIKVSLWVWYEDLVICFTFPYFVTVQSLYFACCETKQLARKPLPVYSTSGRTFETELFRAWSKAAFHATTICETTFLAICRDARSWIFFDS